MRAGPPAAPENVFHCFTTRPFMSIRTTPSESGVMKTV
jgi:hypothetical protein